MLGTKEIQNELGKYCVLKGHFPVAENISFYGVWESDVISMTKTGYLWEYEVKISRSDFKADFKKGRKHDLYSEGVGGFIPNYFAYACPKGLISLEEVPEHAGLYYVDEDGIEEIRKPKLLTKHKHDSGDLMKKCLRVYAERHFLGCCMLTHKNREIKRKSKEFFNDDGSFKK